MSVKVYSKEKWCFPEAKKLRTVEQDLGVPVDDLMMQIFAPDPITGNPGSDIALLVKGENAELNEYIRTHLMNVNREKAMMGSSDEDGEAALDALPRLSDDVDTYYKRLAELASVNINNQEVK